MSENTNTNFNTNFNLNNLLSSSGDGSLEIGVNINNSNLNQKDNKQTATKKDNTKTISQDTFASAVNKVGVLTSGDGSVYLIKPTDQIAYDKESNQVYILRKTLFGYEKKYISGDPNNFKLVFPFTGQVPPSRNPQGKSTVFQEGDQLIIKEENGQLKFYVKRKDSNGKDQLIEIDPETGDLILDKNRTDSVTNPPAGSSLNGNDVQKAISSITSKGQLWDSLGLPPGIRPATVNVTGVVPGLGDFTGATIQVGTVVSSQIYNTLQQTLSAINYLNTTPANPNPNFSYIPGQPPYGQASEEQKKQQAQVYAALRTTIIAQLTRIAQQLREAYDGFKRQTDAAATYKGEQDKTVGKFVTDAFAGGGGGAPGGG